MSNWHTADRGWSSYWSNGPEQVAAALVAPPTPVYGVRTLEDMTHDELDALETQYQSKILDRDRLPPFRSP